MPSDAPSNQTSSNEQTARDARTVSAVTMLSRVFGLVRDASLARVLGDTAVGSAFAAAFVIPNLLRRLFGEGALAAAFLPEYTRAQESRGGLASIVIWRTSLLTTGLTIVGELLLLTLLLVLPPDPNRNLSLQLAMLLLPFMPLVCATAALGAMLQARGRFFVPAAAPIVLNVCMIIPAGAHIAMRSAGHSMDPRAGAVWVSIGVVVAGALQVAWALRALGGGSFRSAGRRARVRARRVLRRLGPAALGLGVVQLNTLIDTVIAMWPIWMGPAIFGIAYPLDDRSNAVLFFSQRLYQFPLGVFGVAIAIAAFPALSRAARDGVAFSSALRDASLMSLAIALPAGVGLALVGRDLCAVILSGGGGFTDDGVVRGASVLLGYAAGLWAYGLNQVLTRGFYARGDVRTPVRIAWACVGCNVVCNLVLIWPLGEAGLAWSTAISAGLQWFLLRRAMGAEIRAERGGVGTVWRMVAASGVMGLAVGGLLLALPAGESWWGSAGRLALGSLVGIVVYWGVSRALGVRELDRLVRPGR